MARPLVIGGNVWRVVRVSPGDPLLIDRTGVSRLATTDPSTRTIRISEAVPIRLFDRVYLHEAAHAAMDGAGVPELLAGVLEDDERVLVEELMAWFVETHSIQVIDAVGMSLGRPVCVSGLCIGGDTWR